MRNIILREMNVQFFVFNVLAISVAISNFIVMVVIFNANPFCILKQSSFVDPIQIDGNRSVFGVFINNSNFNLVVFRCVVKSYG